MGQSIYIRSLVDSHIQPFVVVDRERRVVAVNRAFEQRFGLQSEDAAGRACYRLLRRADGTAPCPCRSADGGGCPFEQVFEGCGPSSIDRVMQDRDGRRLKVRVHAFALHAESGETYLAELIQELPDAGAPAPVADKRLPPMLGRSAAFNRTRRRLRQVAAFDVPVLLQGATGTGKELAARYLHEHSRRREGRLMTVDCTVLTETLFESELFGHERGAFTGSVGERQGLFELADGGTLFLDEIGELTPALQAKLLRVLETGSFRRVGGRSDLHADVRIICATNRELRDSRNFRQDLYYRISTTAVRLPSLAERREDIAELALHMLDRMSQDAGVAYHLSEAALRRLADYAFPGNIRELRNLLWSAASQSEDGLIDYALVAEVLPGAAAGGRHQPSVRASAPQPDGRAELAGLTDLDAEPGDDPALADLARLEAGHLARLLGRYGGNRRRVAKALGVSERTVYRKLKRHRLN